MAYGGSQLLLESYQIRNTHGGVYVVDCYRMAWAIT
jgi:hypothetical protein